MKPIKVIDLFAGPGGLGEGFSNLRTPEGSQTFKIALSIEKEKSAHRTLTLRALFRQFPDGKAPEAYYAFLRGELGASPEDQLYKLPELQNELANARLEAQTLELGAVANSTVYKKVRDALCGDAFILLGGPPCQAYSLVGRARNIGERSKPYDPDADHRNFLYKEYLRIIAKFQPMAFVMENVKGILSAKTSEGPVFPKIKNDLTDPRKSSGIKPDRGQASHNYRIFSFVVPPKIDLFGNEFTDSLDARDFIMKAEHFGIPQARHRVILLGIREDIAGEKRPDTLPPYENGPTVRDVIGELPVLKSKLSKPGGTSDAWKLVPKETAKKLRGFASEIPSALQPIVLGNVQGPKYRAPIGSEFGMKTTYKTMPPKLVRWFKDDRMNGYITNHSARGHILNDLSRYWFAANYRTVMGRSPKALDFPKPLWPAHANFGSGKFADRFRVQGWDAPSTTITSHISKDGHYFIHPDPTQMRSLTVREAARLQTFPDNYHFVGNRTEQYVQVGNAVPPLLAQQLAIVIKALLV